MARYIKAVCRLCRREGEKLFLKGNKCNTPKCTFAKRSSAPGQHGLSRVKLSNYGLQLREKQKVKRNDRDSSAALGMTGPATATARFLGCPRNDRSRHGHGEIPGLRSE